MDTHTELDPYENRGKYWNSVPTSQGSPKIADIHKKL